MTMNTYYNSTSKRFAHISCLSKQMCQEEIQKFNEYLKDHNEIVNAKKRLAKKILDSIED